MQPITRIQGAFIAEDDKGIRRWNKPPPTQEVPHFNNEAARREFAKLNDLPPPARRAAAAKLVHMVPIYKGYDVKTLKAINNSNRVREKPMEVTENSNPNMNPPPAVPGVVVDFLKKTTSFTATQIAHSTGIDGDSVPQRTGRTDKMLQKLKKAGLVEWKRTAGTVVWSLTKQGQEYFGGA